MFAAPEGGSSGFHVGRLSVLVEQQQTSIVELQTRCNAVTATMDSMGAEFRAQLAALAERIGTLEADKIKPARKPKIKKVAKDEGGRTALVDQNGDPFLHPETQAPLFDDEVEWEADGEIAIGDDGGPILKKPPAPEPAPVPTPPPAPARPWKRII
jgi:hypothetical protein